MERVDFRCKLRDPFEEGHFEPFGNVPLFIPAGPMEWLIFKVDSGITEMGAVNYA